MSFEVLKNRRRAQGFTLIELLVVVAIIALLLSILLPSLERARAQARKIVCLTNLQSQGKAVVFYASDNEGIIPRGLVGRGGGGSGAEFGTYTTMLLPYLGYSGHKEGLWGPDPENPARPNPVQQRRIRRILRNWGDLFQCPDFPDEAHGPWIVRNGERTSEIDGRPIDTSLLDYVSSAMPIPYTQAQANYDSGNVTGVGGGENDGWEGQRSPDYTSIGNIDTIALAANPARIIFVTEAHISLQWTDFAFHHFFLTSMLPFGQAPRIANDERHPGGITAMFFDSHATSMSTRKMDPGWPNDIGSRLLLFSPLGFDL